MATGIEWTDETWNPLVGCSMVSPGCANCYAETMANRLKAMAEADIKAGKNPGKKRLYLDVINDKGRWTGKVNLDDAALREPFSWKKPQRVFVNSMSDLFHESVPFEFIDKVFAVMAMCPTQTFQILTKRPERMAEYLADDDDGWGSGDIGGQDRGFRLGAAAGELLDGIWVWTKGQKYRARIERFIGDAHAADIDDDGSDDEKDFELPKPVMWPLPNVWLGTSVENQKCADERILHLLKCPAAVRFISAEPLLGPVDLFPYLPPQAVEPMWAIKERGLLHWVIVGGESGPGSSRPFNIEWARSIVRQCGEAGVACFVKQLGRAPMWANGLPFQPKDKKGGDPAEWPADLRVRQMPTGVPYDATH